MISNLKWAHAANHVKVAGSFNQWQAVEMQKNLNGDFELSVSFTGDAFTYKFIVDGEWRCNPDYILASDGQGNTNNLYITASDALNEPAAFSIVTSDCDSVMASPQINAREVRVVRDLWIGMMCVEDVHTVDVVRGWEGVDASVQGKVEEMVIEKVPRLVVKVNGVERLRIGSVQKKEEKVKVKIDVSVDSESDATIAEDEQEAVVAVEARKKKKPSKRRRRRVVQV